MSVGQVRCRFCACAEDEPCRLETNEACVLNVQTSVCNSPKCILAQQQLQKRADRRVAEERKSLVEPIAQRFIESRRRQREARKNKSRKYRRAA